MVESQAVGRRKQAKGAPCPLIPRDSLKTPELFLTLLGFEALCIVAVHSTVTPQVLTVGALGTVGVGGGIGVQVCNANHTY